MFFKNQMFSKSITDHQNMIYTDYTISHIIKALFWCITIVPTFEKNGVFIFGEVIFIQ